MIYASVCSGVEAASLAWIPLGWKAAWFSEIEPFPCAVLKHRFPEVPNLGDMTKIKVETIENETGKLQRFKNESGADVVVPGGVDLLVGGTPCQSFSFAGNRSGLRGVSGLSLTYCKLLETMHPRWFVWENVPGVFSSNGGEDFKTLLKAFDDVGYSCAWRVLDAQYVRVDGYPRAVPQRRRRVFVVGHLGSDFRCPAEVLFEPGSVFRTTPPRRSKGSGVARSLTASTGGASGKEQQCTFISGDGRLLNALGVDGYNGAISGQVSATVDTNCKNVNGPTLVMANGQANSEVSEAFSPALTCDHESPIVCAGFSGGQGEKAGGIGYEDEVAPTIRVAESGSNQVPNVICYENHAQDSRIKPCGEYSPQINAKAGTGGCNLPLVQECFPINSMIIGKNVKVGDRQFVGIGNNGDPLPSISSAHHHAVAVAENIIGRKENNGGNGTGAQVELAYTQNATGVMGVCYTTQGENQNADAEKARAVKILRLLRDEIGEKAFCEWTLGRLGSFQAEKVLQPNLHGESVRREAGEEKIRLDDSALSCAKNNAKNALRCLWEQFQLGHPSQGQELAQQFTAELNLRLSQLPHEIASVATVRRLLPIETERLMGFPDNWTRIPWRSKPEEECPDSHRYKACGNSMCVNVMRWIGMRIELTERKIK